MKNEQEQVVYHFGYRKQSVDELEQWLGANESAVIVDIRYGKISPTNMWSKESLESRFGEAYVHVRALGNENYKGGPIVIKDHHLGLAILEAMMEEGFDPVLLCSCEDYHECHRKTIVELLEQEMEVDLREALTQQSAQMKLF